MLGKFDLGSKTLMVVDRLFEKSRVWSKKVENGRVSSRGLFSSESGCDDIRKVKKETHQ